MQALVFLSVKFSEEMNTGDMLNIIISSYMCSLSSLISDITEDKDEEMKKLVKLFIDKIFTAVLSMPNIKRILK
jgi:hypothetical protein